jgi:glutathione S-transferase
MCSFHNLEAYAPRRGAAASTFNNISEILTEKHANYLGFKRSNAERDIFQVFTRLGDCGMTAEFSMVLDRPEQPYAGTARYRIVEITVPEAARLLERHRAAAKRNPHAIRNYAQAMRERRWILNGMPIIISRQGVLLDGYQRLSACVEARTAFDSFISEDVEEDACHTIDQQRRRSFASVLEARGVAHAHALQSCLLKLIRYDQKVLGKQPGQMPSWAAMDRILRANPQLETTLAASFELARCALPEAVRSPLMFMGYQIDKALTDRLLDAVINPERYALNEPGVLLLHEIKRGAAKTSLRRGTEHLLALGLKALDATLNHEVPRRLSWTPPDSAKPGEPYPRLRRYSGLKPATLAATFDTSLSPFSCAIKPSAGLGEISQRYPAVCFDIESIDQDVAARYLAQNKGNRQLSTAHIEALARDIAQDRWMFNAQPICFATNGELLNGQHRLHAVILAGRAIEVPVVRNLDPAAFATYDNHAKRRAQFNGDAESFGDIALAAAMANLLWHHERKTLSMRNAKATAAEIQQIIAEHPRMLVLRSFARRMGQFGRASVIGYAAYVMEREDAELAAQFLAALETGADQRPGHPILTLRGTLQKLRANKAAQSEQLNALLAGWERFKARHFAA